MQSALLQPKAMARAIVLLALVAACLGCATPQRMPATVIHAQVLDAETDAPVAGAKVDLRYVPPRGGATVAAVATTDAEGKVILQVPATWLSSEFGAVYFAGGYWRLLAVTAEGYDDGGFSEGPQLGLFERRLNLLAIDRTPPPPRNTLGALRSLRQEVHPNDAESIITTFELLDGPRAGDTVRVSMTGLLEDWTAPGEKFYLTQPFDVVEAEYAARGLRVGGSSIMKFVRVATTDEPYEPAAAPGQ